MSKEIEKTIEDMNFGGTNHVEQNDKAFFESGWKAARDKILEILKNNIETDCSNDYGPGMGGAEPDNPKSINIQVIKEIGKL